MCYTIMSKRKLTKERRIYLRWQVSERRRAVKQKAVAYKGGKCEKCGYSKSIRSLVFHHLNPDEKDFGIASSNSTKWDIVKSELDKCIMLCANCHGEVHDEIDKVNNEHSYNRMRQVVHKKNENQGSIIKECFNCKKQIKIFKSTERKRNFCSRKCSDEVVYKTSWENDEVMLELIKNNTVKEIASRFKKSLSITYDHIKKLKVKYSLV